MPVRRFHSLLAIVAVALVIATGCQRFQSDAPEPTPAPTDTPVLATAVPTPSVGSEIIEGRRYIRQPLQGATLRYEELLDPETVWQLQASYVLSRQLLTDELGVDQAIPLDIYLSSASEIVRFAQAHDFQHPAWLGGFYYFRERDGRIEGAEVFVNAAATSIPQTVGHEMTHLRTPSAPIWLSEGIAEYMGSRVSTVLDPLWQQRRMLQARHTVRSAVLDGTLPGFEALTRFEWNAIGEYALLEMIYSETWQITEFIARTYGSDTLSRILLLYDEGLSHTEDPFPQLLGRSAADLWSAFGTDIVENLNEQERVGLTLCSIDALAKRSLAVTDEWNSLVSLSFLRDQQIVQARLRSVHEGWLRLLSDTKALEPSGDAIAVRGLFIDYFEIMVHALGLFQQGDTSSADAFLSLGNDMALRSATVINSAFAERSWLSC
ncbi:MAG: hypothetical protein O7F09_05635 [Chloroflexi bacterium]|nr:hypothetical protein [Chloroflexota bacterium]